MEAELRRVEREHRQADDPSSAWPGGAWIFNRPDKVPAVWGEGDEVAWSEDEALMLVGSDGSGKTTLAQQLTLRMVGLDTSPLLGNPVQQRTRVLYLALDRPAQAARAFKRLVGTVDRTTLDDRLKVIDWSIGMVDEDPDLLLNLARDNGCDTIVVDAVKDCVREPSSETSGQALKVAYQTAIAGGCQICLLHHDRKQVQGGRSRRLMTLSDVYGSRFMTAGCGSVIALNGTSGDPVIELRQLKQPMAEVGPLKVTFDFDTGGITVFEGGDLLAIVKAANGVTAHDAAKLLYETDKVSASDRERARRKLKHLIGQGLVYEKLARAPEPSRFYLTIDLTGGLTHGLTGGS
jgi:replicative DNA helicase